ncbi:MAG: hypothetical protein ACF8Q5_14940 [Phycisphaerales bacterium JB040]
MSATHQAARVTRLLAPISLLLFLASLAILALTTVLFVRAVVPAGMFPLREFDANTPTQVGIDTDRYRLIVYVQVPESRAEPPDCAVTVTDADGDPIELAPTTGYADLLGRHYRRVGRFEVDSPQAVTVTAEAGPLEDFAVFHDFSDVFEHRTDQHLPGWIAGGVLLIASLACLVAFVLTSEKRMERRLAG